ncbi:hypothetical protein J5I95_24455 [Candidatus Poribacteria bacterium]|nr:hypothetical protein [Candidatus Poribacteria bacterium]
MLKKCLTRHVILIIMSVAVLIVAVFGIRTQPPLNDRAKQSFQPSPPKTPVPSPAAQGNGDRRGAPRPGDNRSSDAFLGTIIDNNIFRPLGWTPPRPIEPYRLLGTVLPTDDRTPPKAILQTTTGQRTLIVSTGEQIDAETEVVEIQRKQVRLSTEGQTRTLTLTAPHFLNPSRVSNRFASQRQSPVRPPPSVRRIPTPAPDRMLPLSEWQTREGEVIRLGDARLKNPAKWGLLRR